MNDDLEKILGQQFDVASGQANSATLALLAVMNALIIKGVLRRDDLISEIEHFVPNPPSDGAESTEKQTLTLLVKCLQAWPENF